MESVDPATLLEWLQTGSGEERDLQLMALEQLCMLLLMSDNIDRCFEMCPPRSFLPALGKIFLDPTAPENILEVTARATTYYLDVSNECTKRITQVDGAVKAICHRLILVDMDDRTSKDLAEQCVKLLEHVCQRESSSVYEAGGLQSVLHFIRVHSPKIHKDTMHSAMSVVTRLCSKVEPHDSEVLACSSDLGALLNHEDEKISECALRCFAALVDRFIRKSMDPIELATSSDLIDHLLSSLASIDRESSDSDEAERMPVAGPLTRLQRTPAFISIVLSLLSNICRGSAAVTDQILHSPRMLSALKSVLENKDERCVLDGLRLCDLLVVLLCEGRGALGSRSSTSITSTNGSEQIPSGASFDRAHRHLIDAIRQRDTDALIDAVESGSIDANYVDDVGQTLLNWCAAFGTSDMVIYLLGKGADPNKGQRSSSLHYAATFGRPDIVKILLQHGANPDLHDEEGKTPLDKARERSDENRQLVIQILESPPPVPYVLSTCDRDSSRKDVKEEEEECSGSSVQTSNLASKAAPLMDLEISRKLIRQLIPVFCSVFQKSYVGAVHRSTLNLLRKCIAFLTSSNCAIAVASNGGDQDDGGGGRLLTADALIGVIVGVFNEEDCEDVESKEHTLSIMKSLLESDPTFWLEQFIRLGISEKIEAIVLSLDAAAKSSEVPAVSVISPGNLEGEKMVVATSDSSTLDSEHSAPLTDQVAKRKRTSGSTSSGILSMRADLVEAATAVAQALGVQIVDDSTGGLYPTSVSSSSTLPTPQDIVGAPSSGISSGGGNRKKKDGSEDAWKLINGFYYKWSDWRIVRGVDSLFLWCDAVAIELSDGSNGWLRFLVDSKLRTMYSSGTFDSGTDNAECRAEFIAKFQKAKASVPTGSLTKPIFTTPRHPNLHLESGNWRLSSVEAGVLCITNREGNGQQVLYIKEELPGFVFESSAKGTKHTIVAESTLGLDFVTGWAARGGGRRLKFREEAHKQKLHDLAKEIWDGYMKEATMKPRGALVDLQELGKKLGALVLDIRGETDLANRGMMAQKLSKCLSQMRDSITNERLLSVFEISVSGVIAPLLLFAGEVLRDKSGTMFKVFNEVFTAPILAAFTRRIVAVMEAIEKFPVHLYDVPGGSPFGLQLLTRRIRLKLEQAFPVTTSSVAGPQLIDRSSRSMKVEPLATVGSLREYLLSMIVRKWHDQPREEVAFVKQLKAIREEKGELVFNYESDFDTNGLIWYLGTNGKANSPWINPATINVVRAACSDSTRQPYGRPEDILSRDVSGVSCHTSDSPNANFTLDLGVWLKPTAYTLRHASGYSQSALRGWLLQASKDNHVWEMLMAHSNDQSLSEPASTATWPLEAGQGPYRYIRIAQNGKNSGNTYVLSLAGFEIYGHVVDVVTEELKSLDSPPALQPAKQSRSHGSHVQSGFVKKQTARKSGADLLTSSSSAGTSKQGDAIARGGGTGSRVPTTTTGVDIPSTHYARPPTAASLRQQARKQQKMEKVLGVVMDSAVGSNQKMMMVDDEMIKKLPSGPLNNKLRALRSRRSGGPNYPLMTSSKSRTPTPGQVGTDAVIQLGSRVMPSADWVWGNQNNGQLGTVVSVGNGWLDVEWDSGEVNSYRHGHCGKFDVQQAASGGANQGEEEARSPHSDFTKSWQSPTPTTHPFPLATSTPLPSGTELSQQQEASTEGLFQIVVENFNSPPITNSADQDPMGWSDATDSSAVQLAIPSNNPSAGSSMTQKSMSTTNLLDRQPVFNPHSVASTNQAASAESLQHQTPSLENLLARSRIYGERMPIPEVATEDGQRTPIETGATTPSSSAAASTFASSSQPALGSNAKSSRAHTSSSSEEQVGVVEQVVEEEEMGQERTMVEESEQRAAQGAASSLATSIQSAITSSAPQILDPDSMEFYEGLGPLVRAYSEMLVASGGGGQSGSAADEGVSDVEESLLHQYVGDSLLSELPGLLKGLLPHQPVILIHSRLGMAFEDLHSSSIDSSRAGGSTSHEPVGLADGSDARSTNSRQQPLSELGLGLRTKLSNYADVLRRAMMQQVMAENGSVFSAADDQVDDIDMIHEPIIYDEEMDTSEGGHYVGIESCEDDEDDSESLQQPPPSSLSGNTNEEAGGGGSGVRSSSFQSKMSTLASAAAALRRQFSASASTSSTHHRAEHQLSSRLKGGAPGSDAKMNWREFFMYDEGGFLSGEGPHPHGSSISSVGPGSTSKSGAKKKSNRSWDDDFVLRRQFGALLPAFDPRPGRTNLNQTQEVELDDTISSSFSPQHATVKRGSLLQQQSATPFSSPGGEVKIRLFLRGPNLEGIENETVELEDETQAVFYYLQQLLNITDWGSKFSNKYRTFWEPTYSLLYTSTPSNEDGSGGDLRKSQRLMELEKRPEGLVKEALDLIAALHHLVSNHRGGVEDCNGAAMLSANVFHSSKLTQKLVQLLSDPLIVAACTLPTWSEHLVTQYPCLFSTETRTMYLRGTAFGCSRAITWLQQRRDQLLEKSRASRASASSSNMAGARREDHYPEYRIGRIKHERIKVHRGEDRLMESAVKVLNFHALRKSVLEIEYYGEEGTGLGPTLEFYALLAAEFQRKALAMWVCDDGEGEEAVNRGDVKSVDVGGEAGQMEWVGGEKPAGYYVRRPGGLFPAYLPPGSDELATVAERFRILGIFLAKVIQDGRMVDIPLSTPFFKLMILGQATDKMGQGALDYKDLEIINPTHARFFSALQKLIEQKRKILASSEYSSDEKKQLISALRYRQDNTTTCCSVEDLGLTFVLNRPSSVFEFDCVELVENGAQIDVTMDNIESYVERCLEFLLAKGVEKQMAALREGFDSVFPLKALQCFSPEEMQVLISGEQCPRWTREEILKYTEPKLGYTRDSVGFLNFVEVLLEMNASERKSFLQFATGCSSMPPGGLANLHPRLTVVQKVGSGDGSYPSVNTCVHYLKLPEYSSAAILKERLLAATKERGFYLN